MYIAFKWLLGLSLTMWLTMCFTDIYIKMNKKNVNAVMDDINPFESVFKNVTSPLERKTKHIKEKIKYDGMAILHGAMFFAGALAVTIFNRKTEIISYTKFKFSKLNARANAKNLFILSYETVRRISIAMVKYLQQLWEITCKYMRNLKTLFPAPKKIEFNKVIHYALLNKLKDLDEERKNLGKLLIAVIHEHKNIKMQYQLEIMAKSRLARHMEDTQRQVRENRSRYINFQQLHLISHQENTYLKARVRKLIKEKDEAEHNLMVLMNEVYKSKSQELKIFCSRFIVKLKNNLLNSDVSAEIQKFLQKPVDTQTCTSNWQLSQHHRFVVDGTNSWPTCTRLCDTEIREDSIVPSFSDAPKLKGLPGEYIWTVRDKNGIIEKLYEYDYEADYDNGDTIRRIKQYSVYYDKDCLLDFTNSKTIIHEIHGNHLLKNQRFLTGSKAFQQFLKSNHNIMTSSSVMTPPTQPLFCG